MEFLVILLIAFAALWFMSSRTRKQQREAADFRANLVLGDEVMTASGLFGTVTAINDDVITLESTPGTSTRWLRAAIGRKVTPDESVVAAGDGTTDVPPPPASGPQDDVVDVDVPDDLSSLPPEPPAKGQDDRDTK